jgi:hypothetical protein
VRAQCQNNVKQITLACTCTYWILTITCRSPTGIHPGLERRGCYDATLNSPRDISRPLTARIRYVLTKPDCFIRM